MASPIPQRILSQRLDDLSFGHIIGAATDADKARLLSISAPCPHAASWLTVVPSVGLGLHLDPNELQIVVKWWLGLDTSRGSSCALCSDVALDPLGHHAATCRCGGDVVIRHNRGCLPGLLPPSSTGSKVRSWKWPHPRTGSHSPS